MEQIDSELVLFPFPLSPAGTEANPVRNVLSEQHEESSKRRQAAFIVSCCLSFLKVHGLIPVMLKFL